MKWRDTTTGEGKSKKAKGKRGDEGRHGSRQPQRYKQRGPHQWPM